MRHIPIAVDTRQEVGHARAANPLLRVGPQQRSRLGRVGSVAHEPSIEPRWCHVISKVGTAHLERFGFPDQYVDGSCAPRPMAGAYREGSLSARLPTLRGPGASRAKLSTPPAPRTFLVVIGVVDA
jgi:hypothetical protein